ncbi:MAG: 50S ribosomal protein L6 [Clostridia bacterium]|nr:50S ribosomal protein L6 [Clostridia bacterium]
MSRIGRAPISVPAGVTVDVNTENEVIVTGPKGSLRQWVDPTCIKVAVENGHVVLSRNSDENQIKAKHGLYRALIANMVKGVVEGYSKSVTISGIGYKCAVQGNKIVLNIGYSHPVNIEIPRGLTATCPSATEIVISGIDKTAVGQFAADIKALKKVEPYHGYGIYYTNEPVRRKEIKKGKK